jgi:hypothetical protein
MSLDCFFFSPFNLVKYILPPVTNMSGKSICVYSIFHSSPVYIIKGKKLIHMISVKRESPRYTIDYHNVPTKYDRHSCWKMFYSFRILFLNNLVFESLSINE